MKLSLSSLLVALFVCFGGWGLTESPVEAQIKSEAYTDAFQVPYYLVQVEYARPRPRPRPSHYGGYHGSYGRYRYVWMTVAESADPEEAEFIYDLFELAWELGVLDEVAPDFGQSWFPLRVRMITEYRSVEPANSATLE